MIIHIYLWIPAPDANIIFLTDGLQAPRLAGAASKVDSLVKEAANDAPTQPSPSKGSRRALLTSIPAAPGLSLAQDFPSLPAPTKPPATTPVLPQSQRKATASKTAAAGVQPAIPKKLPGSNSKAISPADAQADHKASETPNVGIGKAKEEVRQALKKDEDGIQRTDTEVQQFSDSFATKSEAANQHENPSKSSEKRQRPEKIDIGAAKDASMTTLGSASESSKTPKTKELETSSAATPSQPATPATVASKTTASPAMRLTQQKTIHVGSTPVKNDVASYGVPTSPGNMLPSASSKQVSRRPSVTSMQQPGTPVSERISDNASLASTSLSRTNSPPPSRIGTTPIRTISKAQQKKERQARAKQAEEAKAEHAPTKFEEPAIVQEPIVGRKKKTKKAKQGTADSTPAPTRPSSPDRKPSIIEEATEEPVPPIPPKESNKANVKAAPEPNKPEEPALDDPQKQLTALAIFSNLIASGELDPSASDLFKAFAGINTRFESTADLLNTSDQPLSDTDTRRLDTGAAVWIEDGNGRSTIVLPDRRTLRGFTSAQAQRFLELAERNGPPHLNPELENLLPLPKIASSASGAAAAATAVMPSVSQSQDSRLLVNRFATDMQSAPGTLSSGTHRLQHGLQHVLPASSAGVYSVEEAESRLVRHRRETEAIEKKLNALLKRNRRLILGAAH